MSCNYTREVKCTIHMLRMGDNCVATFKNNNIYIVNNNSLLKYDIITRKRKQITKFPIFIKDIYNDEKYLFLVDNEEIDFYNFKIIIMVIVLLIQL